MKIVIKKSFQAQRTYFKASIPFLPCPESSGLLNSAILSTGPETFSVSNNYVHGSILLYAERDPKKIG